MRRIGMLLAVLVTAGLVMGMACLPQIIAHAQDQQLQTRAAYTNGESLSLTLAETEMTFEDKMTVYRFSDHYSMSDIPSSEMEHTGEEALELGLKAVSAFTDLWNGGLIEAGDVWTELHWNQEDGWQFRVWQTTFYDSVGYYYVVALDDATGGVLDITCNGDIYSLMGMLWGFADEWNFEDLTGYVIGEGFSDMLVGPYVELITPYLSEASTGRASSLDFLQYYSIEGEGTVVCQYQYLVGEDVFSIELHLYEYAWHIVCMDLGSPFLTAAEEVVELPEFNASTVVDAYGR